MYVYIELDVFGIDTYLRTGKSVYYVVHLRNHPQLTQIKLKKVVWSFERVGGYSTRNSAKNVFFSN